MHFVAGMFNSCSWLKSITQVSIHLHFHLIFLQSWANRSLKACLNFLAFLVFPFKNMKNEAFSRAKER